MKGIIFFIFSLFIVSCTEKKSTCIRSHPEVISTVGVNSSIGTMILDVCDSIKSDSLIIK